MAQGVRLSEDVLPVEWLTAWREEGLSFAAIGERVGYSGGTVGAYARRVLSPELCGRRAGGKKKAKRPLSMKEIRAELKKTREKAEARKRQELAEAAERSDEEARQVVATVREKIEGQPVAAPQEMISIAPLPDLQEGLFIAAGGDGTAAAMVTGPGGLQELLAQQRAGEAWRGFLSALAPDGTLDGLDGIAPPRYVRTEGDCLEYLRQIGAGYVVAGRRARRQVRRFFAREARPIVSRSTARRLELLARLARWLIAREGGR